MAGESNEIEILKRKELVSRISNAADGLLKGSKIATNGFVIINAIQDKTASPLDRLAAAVVFLGSLAEGIGSSKIIGKDLSKAGSAITIANEVPQFLDAYLKNQLVTKDYVELANSAVSLASLMLDYASKEPHLLELKVFSKLLDVVGIALNIWTLFLPSYEEVVDQAKEKIKEAHDLFLQRTYELTEQEVDEFHTRVQGDVALLENGTFSQVLSEAGDHAAASGLHYRTLEEHLEILNNKLYESVEEDYNDLQSNNKSDNAVILSADGFVSKHIEEPLGDFNWVTGEYS